MRAGAAALSDSEKKLMSIDEIDDKQTSVSTETWAVLAFISYLIIGLLFYCYSESHLSTLDSIYLSVVTFSTVGYGKIGFYLFSFCFFRNDLIRLFWFCLPHR